MGTQQGHDFDAKGFVMAKTCASCSCKSVIGDVVDPADPTCDRPKDSL